MEVLEWLTFAPVELDGSSNKAQIFGLVRCQYDKSPLSKSSSNPNRRYLDSSVGSSSLSKSNLSKIANVFWKCKKGKEGKTMSEAKKKIVTGKKFFFYKKESSFHWSIFRRKASVMLSTFPLFIIYIVRDYLKMHSSRVLQIFDVNSLKWIIIGQRVCVCVNGINIKLNFSENGQEDLDIYIELMPSHSIWILFTIPSRCPGRAQAIYLI